MEGKGQKTSVWFGF
uniref:Uncharacterized protein n=1 Tax=Arundo donax TaxID=35708 RepID=A0A0A8ZLT3_ARUDO